VNGRQLLDRFKLDDDQSIHNEICAKAFIKVLSFKFNRNGLLSLNNKPPPLAQEQVFGTAQNSSSVTPCETLLLMALCLV
jgi:hypothetical protein